MRITPAPEIYPLKRKKMANDKPGQKPQRDAFYDFKGKKLTGEILDELNYQFMRRLHKEGLLQLKQRGTSQIPFLLLKKLRILLEYKNSAKNY